MTQKPIYPATFEGIVQEFVRASEWSSYLSQLVSDAVQYDRMHHNIPQSELVEKLYYEIIRVGHNKDYDLITTPYLCSKFLYICKFTPVSILQDLERRIIEYDKLYNTADEEERKSMNKSPEFCWWYAYRNDNFVMWKASKIELDTDLPVDWLRELVSP